MELNENLRKVYATHSIYSGNTHLHSFMTKPRLKLVLPSILKPLQTTALSNLEGQSSKPLI